MLRSVDTWQRSCTLTLTDPPSQNRERAPGHRLARGVLSALGNLGFEALGEFPAPKGRRMD
ncbi:MAG: hypothetical protein AAF565_20830, partial [Pseudomonadota bacterium]